jgi:hypothetical protein
MEDIDPFYDDVDLAIESKKRFQELETTQDFFALWTEFYDNKIYIPSYGAKFIEEDHDNPQADTVLANKLKKLTLNGVIPVDSQVMIPFRQKAYISLYCPKNMIKIYCAELNRFEDIVAFWGENDDTQRLNSLYVTYDALSDSEENENKSKGNPFSQLSLTDPFVLTTISKWLSNTLKEKINYSTFAYLNIMSPSFKTDPLYIFDTANKAWENIQLYFTLEKMIKEKEPDIIEFINEHKNDLSLEFGKQFVVNIGIIVLSSKLRLPDKQTILNMFFEMKLFPVPSYEYLKKKSNKTEDDKKLQDFIKPFLPEWYK